MCGIAGIYLQQRPIDPSVLHDLSRRISHRGPDGVKVHIDGSLGFAHARLSIIDLQGGGQPLFADDGRLALIANGEIYNFVELREELESRGAVFGTQSDCEVILHAYRHYGERFVDRLNGMFAFALYDRTLQRLLLVRDRMGIKPLFFVETPAGIYFASEQKALHAVVPGGIRINDNGLVQTLENGFSTGGGTLVRGIRRLVPGEMAVFDSGYLSYRQRYWSPFPVQTSPSSYEQAAERFESLMPQVMAEHMRSDVPYAVFLSGGVDSSVVLNWLQRGGATQLHTYTVAMQGISHRGEFDVAKSIVRRLNLQHTVVELDGPSLFRHLPYAIWAADDLILDDAILPTSLLAQRVSREFKVVFSGEGGDELFAGYGRYRRNRLQRWLANLRAPGSGGFRTRGGWNRYWRKTAYDCELRAHLAARRQGFVGAWCETPGSWTDLQRMQYTDVRTELADQLLVKADRALMAWGLEGRVPLLDHRLVEFAFALPDELKVHDREGKYFLRRWAASIYGDDEMRRPKRGFSVPIAHCVDASALQRLKSVLPGHPAFRGLFDRAGVRELVCRQQQRGDAFKPLWSLLQFAIWHRIFVDGRGAKPDPDMDPVDLIA